METTPLRDSWLDLDQHERVEALQTAGELLRGKSMFGSGPASDIDGLIRVARYIVTGQDLIYADDAHLDRVEGQA
jgi:hypothetical protein